MNHRLHFIPCLFAMLAGPASAGSISTDRPGNGNAPSTVPEWRVQVETSALYARDSGADFFTMPTAIRLGLPAKIELRLASGLFGVLSADGIDTETDAVDTVVGAKYFITENQGAIPQLGVVVDVSLPTGGDAFTADAVVPDARFAGIWSLPANFSALVNLGVELPDDDAGRYTRIVYVASLGYSITDQLFVFGESFGRVSTDGDRDSILQLDFGAAYLLSDDMQLDIFTQHGLNDASPDFQLAAGFSVRI